jgi:hypothetical protein
MPATHSVVAPGAWAIELLVGADGDDTTARVGGVWSVSGDSALATGQDGGSILVFQRHAPGQSIVQTVQVR